MNQDIKFSMSLVSHVHSSAADFLAKKIAEQGLPDFVSSHGNILFQLSINKELTMSELAKRINRDKSTTTVLVRKLEREGLISGEVDSKDKRNRLMFLTEKGAQYKDVLTKISSELLETFYKGFSEEEKQQFFSLLNRINENFQ